VEESNLEQQIVITSLEQTCQDLKKHVVTHIEFEKEKENLTTQIQDWKSQYEIAKV